MFYRSIKQHSHSNSHLIEFISRTSYSTNAYFDRLHRITGCRGEPMGINIAGLSGMDVLPVTQQTVEALKETQSIDPNRRSASSTFLHPPPDFWVIHTHTERCS